MNTETGAVYESAEKALWAGEKAEDLVEIVGTEEQIKKISDAVKAQRKAKDKKRAANKRAKQSRKKNR